LFHEIYQEYLCGCVLRVVRELFSLLPVDTVLVTAVADSIDSRTGQALEKPVLSVAISRETVTKLEFDRLNPADAIEGLQHRAEFKTSRKAEAFQPITPLTPADIKQTSNKDLNLQSLLASIQAMRAELRTKTAELDLKSITSRPKSNPAL